VKSEMYNNKVYELNRVYSLRCISCKYLGGECKTIKGGGAQLMRVTTRDSRLTSEVKPTGLVLLAVG
jgi:hypothetical protein